MGKKIILLICTIIGLATLTVTAAAGALPLSAEGKQEAALYTEMLQGFLQKNDAGPVACLHYKRALAYNPTDKFIRRQLLLCALEQKQPEQADLYADFIEQEPNDAEDLSIYAFYLWRKGNLKEAQSYYEQSLQKVPDDTHTLYQYIVMLGSLDFERAVQELQARKDQLPDLAAALDFETGNLYRHRKQWKRALEYYDKALQTRPNYVEAHLAKAEVYEKTSQFFFMMREMEAAEKLGYGSAAMFTRMGSFYVLVKKEDQARVYFEKAKQLAPDDNVAGYFLALYAEQDGDFLKAAQYLQETAGYPTEAGKWLRVSFYQQQSGDIQAALHTLQEAYKRFEKNVEIGYFYGLLLQDVGDYRRSAKVLHGVLQTNPDYEQARLGYAFALEGQKKYKEMEQQLERIVQKNPQQAAAYNLWGFSLADRNERLDQAQELIAKALSLQPQDRAYIDSLAWLYYRQGKYQEALQLLTGLGEDFIQSDAEAAYHLGAVYVALEQFDKAEVYLEQAAAEEKQAAKLLKKLRRRGLVS